MSTSPDDRRRRLSRALLRARETRVAIAPLIESEPDLSVADAYAIAGFGVDADLARGARVVGHKVGLTARAIQEQLGVSEPDYGVLLDTMAIADGASVDARDYLAPRIEAELAFRLRAPLTGSRITLAEVTAASATVHPAFELVDSRIADWRISLVDTVADRGSSAGYVIGEPGLALDALDVAAVEVALERDGAVISSGRSDVVLGDPRASVAWLAGTLAELGEPLAAGEIVLSGAITGMHPVAPGERYTARFGAGLGELSLTFAG